MTPKQQIALNFIRSRLQLGVVAPSLQEVADHVGISKTGAKRIVDALVLAGDLKRTRYDVRGLALGGGTADGRCPACGACPGSAAKGAETPAFEVTPAGRAYLDASRAEG